MNKIVVLDGYATNPGDLSWSPLESYGEVTVYDDTTAEQVVERLADADVAFTNKTVINAETMEKLPNLKFIGVLATGFNVVDVDKARQLDIKVANVPGYSTEAVGQFTMALLLEVCHHIGHHSATVHDGKWTASKYFTYWDFPLIELTGKTIGMIGFGETGRAAATRAKAFGMKVIAYNRSRCSEGEKLAEYVDEIGDIYRRADIISIHLPLNEQTKRLINAEAIAQMRDGVILINTARGGILDEAAVAEGLNSGKIGYLAADVASREPIEKDNPLLSAPNVILTPHIAWAPAETRERLIALAAKNLGAYLEGNPINIVNA